MEVNPLQLKEEQVAEIRIPSTFESVLLAELNMGLPPTTFYKLACERDDWSFVLKLHAVLECALSVLLRKRLAREKIGEAVTFYGMVNYVFDLPELAYDKNKEYHRFFKAINSLRNLLAHRAKYIVSNLQTVFGDVPFDKRMWLFDSLAVALNSRFAERTQEFRREMILKFPRFAILLSASYALEMLSLAYFIQKGKDGKYYAEEYRLQLQDLLHDPAVIELRRRVTGDFPSNESTN